MIGRIIGLVSIPMFAFIVWGLIRQVRRPAPIRPAWMAIGIVMAPMMLVINLAFLRQAAPNAFGLALLVLGLGFGAAWGSTARLSVRDEQVIANRSVLHLVFWAVSFGLTQALATFGTAQLVAGGLATMFFATGTSLGTNANLLGRQVNLRRARARSAAPSS